MAVLWAHVYVHYYENRTQGWGDALLEFRPRSNQPSAGLIGSSILRTK